MSGNLLSLKERSGRLQMFARRMAENAPPSANVATQNTEDAEKPQEAPKQAMASVAERQELAENARVPVPRPFRQFAGHQRGFSQPPPDPSTRTHSQSPVNHQHRLDLFSGSQLGESFMNSGLTTPQNEPAEPEQEPELEPEIETEPVPEPERIPTPDKRPIANIPREPPRNNFNRDFRPINNAAFHIGEDLLMKVVSGNRRHNPSHMNDGFHNGGINGYSKVNGNHRIEQLRPASPAQKQPRLPMREVKVRGWSPARHIEHDNMEKRSSSPVFESKAWQTRHRDENYRQARFQEVEDDDGTSTVGGHDERFGTPKPRRRDPSPPPRPVDQKRTALVSLPSRLTLNKDKKRRRGSPDYDDMALSNMTYTELQREPFDFDPAKATAHIGHGGGGNLGTKLEQFRQQTEKEQGHMFTNLSVDDWEATGDWFADQFADIMQKLREARRNKRRIIQDFENEAATREEAVRLRSDAIDRKLTKMKQDGQRVVHPNDF